MRFEVFTVMKIQIEFFWVVTSSVVVTSVSEAAQTCETLVSYLNTTHHNIELN
jgi:hypothetical protein